MLRRLIASWRLAQWTPGPVRSREEVEETRRRIARGLVMRKATGNVRLSQGRYMTRADLDREREDLLKRLGR